MKHNHNRTEKVQSTIKEAEKRKTVKMERENINQKKEKEMAGF